LWIPFGADTSTEYTSRILDVGEMHAFLVPLPVVPPREGSEPLHLAVFFSSGGLGDVGRHIIHAALELPSEEIALVRVIARDAGKLLKDTKWKCACVEDHQKLWREGSAEIASRVQVVDLDFTKEDIKEHLRGIDAIVSCLGNRQLFHPDIIAAVGTRNILQAAIEQNIQRFKMLSSVGISEDWPPMVWTDEGRRLESLFRTICLTQYNDFTQAERYLALTALECPEFDFLVVRTVLLSETTATSGKWFVQKDKHADPHPCEYISKMDCAKFLVTETLKSASFHRCAVTVGGVPS
jgi:hypothetical protein